MATEQDLLLEEEEAQARAKADRERNAKMEAQIKANQTPKEDNSKLPAQEYMTDKVLPDSTPGIVRAGVHTAENIANPFPMVKGLAKGAANAGIGALQTANAVGHSIGAWMGEKYDQAAPSVGLSPRDPASVASAQDQAAKDQKIFQDATLKPSTQEERVSMPVGQVAAGMAAGGAVGKVVGGIAGEVLPNAGKIATAGKYLATGLGAAAGQAATNPAQEGLIVNSNGYVGFGIKPEDDPATQQSKKFVNQTIDNMLLGVTGDAAYALGRKGVEVVKNIGNGIFKWNNLSQIQQQAAEDVLSVYAGLGEHPTADQQKEAAQKVIDLIDKNGVDVYDFGEGVGKKTVKKDTVSALTSGLDDSNPFDRAVQTRMEALRASAKRGTAPKTAVQIDEPNRVLNEGMQEAQAVRGGDQAIDQTKQVLQDRAVTEAATADVPVEMAKGDLADQTSDFTSTLKNDPTFGPAVKDAEQGGIPLDINAKERELKGTIVTKAGAAQETDKAIRDSAYKAVADSGAPAKMDEFMAVYQANKEGIPSNIQKLVEKADGTFGYLNNEVKPRISEALNAAYKANDTEAITSLQALKRNIQNDQMAYLTESSNDMTAQLAQKANQANKDYSAKWNDTVGQELRINKNNNRFAPGNLQEKGRDIVDSAISNPNRKESVENLKTILGPDEGLVADTALAKATKDITAGKGANIDKVTSDLQTMANSFGPKEKARLEGFLTDLKNKKVTIEELQSKIPELQKAADAEKEAIFGERFPTLFKKAAGGKQIPQGNGYAVFAKAMDDQQPETINALIKEASKNPEDMAGLQTAWLKSAEGKINASSKQVGKLDDQFVNYGKQIFGEGSPEVETITALRDTAAKLEASLNRPGMEGLSATENQSSFRTALSTIQTWVFGVLNPRAARVRTVTSNLAEAYNSTNKSHEAIDNILSDNQALKSAMVKLIEKTKSQISPAMYKTLWEGAAKMGLFETRKSNGLDFQTYKATRK